VRASWLVAALVAAFPVLSWAEHPAPRLLFAANRPGVEQPYVLDQGQRSDVHNVLVVLTGGPGRIAAGEANGVMSLHDGSFPVGYRQRLADRVGAVVTLDVPSDRRTVEMEFRVMPEHAKDVAGVVDAMAQRYPGAKVYLLGLSNGALSAAYVGAQLQEKLSGA
jgi:hypothetical protein